MQDTHGTSINEFYNRGTSEIEILHRSCKFVPYGDVLFALDF